MVSALGRTVLTATGSALGGTRTDREYGGAPRRAYAS